MKAIEKAVRLCRGMEPLFACPVCGDPLTVPSKNYRNLVCSRNHCYDFSAKGYVNLLGSHQRKSAAPGYTKEVLSARRAMLTAGLFDPVIETLTEIIECELGRGEQSHPCALLDAGCGEGYSLSAMMLRLREGGVAWDAVGMDISKPGITIACGHDDSIMWCVGNIAKRLPFVPSRFDVVTNLLAPENWEEFRRVMRGDGLLVKATPLDNHFIELRSALYERPRERSRSVDDVLTELGTWFDTVETRRLTYGFALPAERTPDLIRMSPLFWKAKPERIEAVERHGLPAITTDLSVVVARPR
jgi:23S rRNA (guanine745-N1)-methyltransferase